MKKRTKRKWNTGAIDREGPARYIHLIRSYRDPERTSREQRKGQVTAWRTLMKRPVPELKAEILELLKDGKPRTFNAIGVELWDKTADILFENAPDFALWQLVDEGKLEHTLEAPIYFRLTTKQDTGRRVA